MTTMSTLFWIITSNEQFTFTIIILLKNFLKRYRMQLVKIKNLEKLEHERLLLLKIIAKFKGHFESLIFLINFLVMKFHENFNK